MLFIYLVIIKEVYSREEADNDPKLSSASYISEPRLPPLFNPWASSLFNTFVSCVKLCIFLFRNCGFKT